MLIAGRGALLRDATLIEAMLLHAVYAVEASAA